MVYRSSRRPPRSEGEDYGTPIIQLEDYNQNHPPDTMEKAAKYRRQIGLWRTCTFVLAILSIALIIVVIILAVDKGDSESPTCGKRGPSPQNDIDLTEPDKPGPFHDLTRHEIRQLRTFLTNDHNIKAAKAETAQVNSSYVFMMDLFLSKKSDVLDHLDKGGPQPARQARVIMYRGDKKPPMVEEFICGPLPKVAKCEMLLSDKRRNPVEFSLRPVNAIEFAAIFENLLTYVDHKIGYILKESYGTSYVTCPPEKCFSFYPSPVGTSLVGDITARRLWLWADYPLEYYVLHPVDFGILAVLDGSDPRNYYVEKVWYHGNIYHSMDAFITFYNSSRPEERSHVRPPAPSSSLYSSLNRRGEPLPKEPQRPPTLVEPDGKRYSLKHRKVEYLGWSFHFRMSALTGPSLYDIRYKGERIAYEMSLSEIVVFYSGNNPLQRVTDFVDSGALIGTHSKALVPGGDCPESATFINQTFSGQIVTDPVEIPRAFCLFENNNGYPLRRHLSYSNFEGAFYAGMLDSVLTLRSVLTIVNYDYVVDFIFHQNGVVETRIMSTGYIFPSFYATPERPYGFKIEDNIIGNIHYHIFHFKADLDISGTSNRYETLDISAETADMRMYPGKKYHQTRFDRNLKRTEMEAAYKYNFDLPRYHIVHNNNKQTRFNEIKAYRIKVDGMSKQLLVEDKQNERSIPWARYQMVTTKHKDEELVSSSPYAMWDSQNPVTNFTSFFADDENIVDEDLVFWITLGLHHIPHTEDLPVTPTVGNHLTFFLLPYNYFDECPSMGSRDQIRIQHREKGNPDKGVEILRNGNSYDTCNLPQVAKEFDEQLEQDPDILLETKTTRGIL